MLDVHAKKVRLAEDADLDRVARGTPMFSGADLAALVNEAAIIATLKDRDAVHMEDLEEARDKVRFGRARKSRRLEREQREANAYHEAGHALLQARLEHADPIDKVTIIPRGQALGATMSLPEKDRYGYGQRYLLATMRVLCGGRIAERRQTGDVSTGAAQDIEMVTRFARNMVLEWGMSERLGFIKYDLKDGQERIVAEKEYSEETARAIDEEVKRLVDQAYDDAERTLTRCWDQVSAIAEALLKYETLNADDIDRILRGETLKKPSIEALIQKEQQRHAGNSGDGDGDGTGNDTSGADQTEQRPDASVDRDEPGRRAASREQETDPSRSASNTRPDPGPGGPPHT
jgi:cell division protease FtsH